jgi:hypothetical protein
MATLTNGPPSGCGWRCRLLNKMDPGQKFVEAFRQSLFAQFRGLGDPFLEGCIKLGTRLVSCSFSAC